MLFPAELLCVKFAAPAVIFAMILIAMFSTKTAFGRVLSIYLRGFHVKNLLFHARVKSDCWLRALARSLRRKEFVSALRRASTGGELSISPAIMELHRCCISI